MMGTIPVMRVNYTIPQLIGSLFVSECSTRYREKLKEMIRIFFEVDDVLLTSSARCAIYMIVRSLPQKKVIVPAYTCEVVIEAIKLARKQVVFASVDKSTLNIKEYPEIDSDTIVVATHQYGNPTDIRDLVKKCRDEGAIVIEDCAGSLGSRIEGRLTGTMGDYGVFSFSASKTLHSPTKGGFIIAHNRGLLDQIKPIEEKKGSFLFKAKNIVKALGFCLAKNKMLSSWLFKRGNSPSNHSEEAYLHDTSYHCGLYEWQAYVVLKQLNDIETILMERRKLFKRYLEGINNRLISNVHTSMGGAFIRFPVLVKNREKFIEHCHINKVSVGVGYNHLYCSEDFSIDHQISREIVYLPFGNGYSEKDIDKVINVVNSFK